MDIFKCKASFEWQASAESTPVGILKWQLCCPRPPSILQVCRFEGAAVMFLQTHISDDQILFVDYICNVWLGLLNVSIVVARASGEVYVPSPLLSVFCFLDFCCLPLGFVWKTKNQIKKSAAPNESFSPVHFYSCAVCSDLKGWRLLEQGVTETRMEKRRRDKMVCWPESLWNLDLLFWFVCLFVFGWVRHGCRRRPPEWDMIISLVVSDVFSCCRNLFSWHELLVWLELI